MQILVVDDEPTSRKLMRFLLEGHAGHVVDEAGSAEEAETLLGDKAYDLALLDVTLPGRDGFQLCTRVRSRSNVPILMISARGDAPSRVHGLQLGADDFLPKPFEPAELLARVDAVLRRSWRAPRVRSDGNMTIGECCLDLAAHQVRVRKPGAPERLVQLTPTEFKLLMALAREPGRAFSRAELERSVWGDIGTEDGSAPSLTALVADLRGRLEEDPHRPRYIQTVRTIGYRLDA